MDELAADVNAEAEMSKRTVYRYFRSKDEIIEATVEKLLHQASTYVIKTVEEAETSEEALTKLLNAFLDLSHKYITYQLMEDMSSHYPHIWRKIDEFRAKNAVLIVKSMYKKGAGKEFREINPLIAVEEQMELSTLCQVMLVCSVTTILHLPILFGYNCTKRFLV